MRRLESRIARNLMERFPSLHSKNRNNDRMVQQCMLIPATGHMLRIQNREFFSLAEVSP